MQLSKAKRERKFMQSSFSLSSGSGSGSDLEPPAWPPNYANEAALEPLGHTQILIEGIYIHTYYLDIYTYYIC